MLQNDLGLEAVVAGFDSRVDAMFRAESGNPLVRAKKQKPLGPGRGDYVHTWIGIHACQHPGSR